MTANGTKPTVIIVEDDPAIRDFMHEVLKPMDCSVALATNGEEAVQILERSPEQRWIMLLDLTMPIRDGWWVVRWLVEHPAMRARTHIILMSAAERLRMASDLEHDGELVKPFDIDTLLRYIMPLLQQQL